MGTNYYARRQHCIYCGRYDKLHIGKCSSGWTFALRLYPPQINNWDDWKEFFKGFEHDIVDECGLVIPLRKMLAIVEDRKARGDLDEMREQAVANNAIMDEETGLLRRKEHAHPDLCIGHGEGPYDYIIGEFS